jgi:hypothetical protein
MLLLKCKRDTIKLNMSILFNVYSISVYLYLHDNQGKSQNNHDIEGPDDDSMDLIRARQLFNSEKNPRI